VADDDEAIRHLISAVLADAGFDVNVASDGQQAWEALLHEPYDLLVTDDQMPRLTGTELLYRIREADNNLPVIIVSGTSPVERLRDAPQVQIAAVLPKPFCLFELLNAVRRALHAPARDTSAGQRAFHRLHASPQPTR
jgi:DNA-binding NtrC family response regulator